MTTEIVSDVDFYDPSNLIPYVELDEAIMGYRAQCKGLLDFSNPDCFAGGAMAVGATAKSLTSGQEVATAITSWGAVSGGMLPVTVAGGRLSLPSTFKLLTTTKRFLFILWLKLLASGYAAGGGNRYWALFGLMQNSSTQCQYGLQLVTDNAGAVAGLAPILPGLASVGLGSPNIGGATLAALADGNLHQLAVDFDGRTGSSVDVKVWRDKTLIASETRAWDNSAIVQPSSAPHVGYSGSAFEAGATLTGAKFGRPSLWDLTGTTLVASDIVARDWDAAQGYLA